MNCPNCGQPIEQDAPCCLNCFVPIERPTFWEKVRAVLQPAPKAPRTPVIVAAKKDTIIKFTDENGQEHEYHSLDELPPDLRAEIQKLEKEGRSREVKSVSFDGPNMKFTSQLTVHSEKTVSTYQIIDEDGHEQVYHSLEEMPPEIREAWEKAKG